MTTTALTVTVDLEWFEYEWALMVGMHRHVESIRQGRKNCKWDSADELLVDVIGACGELAAAKACGVYWNGSVNISSDRGDIGPGWQVRTAYKTPPGRLCIRPRDRDDHVFILVYRAAQTQFHVHGWMTGKEARVVGIQEGFNDHDPAHFVRPEALHPLVDLIGR